MRLCLSHPAATVLLAALVLLMTGVLVLHAAGEGEKPQEPAKPETPKGPVSPGGTVPLPQAPLLKENSRLIDVEGLIVDLKDDLHASPVPRAVFQPKDGLGYFILLENMLLEKTLKETAHGERAVRVRGTITQFRKKNYLMLDWAAVKRD
ncbi:MAG TPA: hypothetical protein VMZ92_12530 [Planctomycetota bacterium]|nr:hypothetical protein [Planctomycetota bacterium]